MKSPLVEALRQASDKESSPDEPDTTDADAEPLTAGPQAAGTESLALLEPMEILPIDGVGIDAAGENEPQPPDSGRSELAEVPATEAAPEPQFAGPTRLSVTGTSRRSALARFGLYTPLVCLLLACVTAAAHFLYRSAASSLAASPVASIPVRPASDPTAPDASTGERFPLLRAADESSSLDSTELVARSPQGHPE